MSETFTKLQQSAFMETFHRKSYGQCSQSFLFRDTPELAAEDQCIDSALKRRFGDLSLLRSEVIGIENSSARLFTLTFPIGQSQRVVAIGQQIRHELEAPQASQTLADALGSPVRQAELAKPSV